MSCEMNKIKYENILCTVCLKHSKLHLRISDNLSYRKCTDNHVFLHKDPAGGSFKKETINESRR